MRKRQLAVWIVRAPHHVVHADDVSQTNTDGILLEAQYDVAVEKIVREHRVLEPVDRLTLALAVGVVHGGEYMGHPGQLELHDGDCQAGMTLEDAGEDQVDIDSAG